MTLQLLKKATLGLAMLLSQTINCQAQDSEETLNLKYWTMRERFRKYYVSLGKDEGQGIPATKRQTGDYSGNRCNSLHSTSSGWMSWGDATSYLGDYMCTLATEYALLTQEGKSTKATLNELYYAINALDRLDGFAEPTFSSNNLPTDYNGFFLRDDVTEATMSHWNTEYSLTGSYDTKLNYQCLNSDRQNNLNNEVRGNNSTNEPSFDQISNILTGFSFIKKYVPNVYVKPTSSDVGFNIISKMQAITAHLMDYMSGADRQLQRADHASEFLFNYIAHPTPAIFGPGTPLAFPLNSAIGYLVADSDCGDNDIRGNWILVNPVTGRKVGVTSNDTKGQDIRLFAHSFAKIGEKLTGDNQYLGRDIHHQSIDHLGDGYYCLSKHDYHVPLSTVEAAMNILENMPAVPQNLIFTLSPPNTNLQIFKPLSIELKSLPRNFYIFECLGSISGTWSHANVNKFASFYGHENIDLIYSCLNDETPLVSRQHYIDLLSKLSCDGPRNYGQSDFTSFWNNGNSFEHPTYDNINTDTYSHGEYNANDWMWLYNMYRLKFGNINFPSYDDKSCNCKKSPVIENNFDINTFSLTSNVLVKRTFKDYLKLGISLKEYITNVLYVDNKTLTNATELIICDGHVYVTQNGKIKNQSSLVEDSVKIVVNENSSLNILDNAVLDIASNTQVVIRKDARLSGYGASSKIVVRSGGKLIVESDGLLELNSDSKLVVEDGGKVIINPLGKFDLNSGCKLVIEDGGLVQVQTSIAPGGSVSKNAVLTFNEGADITLKGNDAVLELNGRLHIGDNATFSLNYGGNPSGYIKFNRGQGVWWDNWSPNNAHITCGNNAKINLKGQSKTDKLIDISQINVAIPKNLAQFTMTKCQIEFNDQAARLETDRPSIINNCTFIKGNLINTSRPGRGLTVYGQSACYVTNCDFKQLGTGVVGALFYGNTKLSGVKKCNFYDCSSGIYTIGGGVTINSNDFFNTDYSIVLVDASLNSFIFNNTIDDDLTVNTNPYKTGIGISGINVETEIKQNIIHHQNFALNPAITNIKVRCNDLRNNEYALFAFGNSKVNMSSLFGGGYNDASDCNQFAWFYETNMFEATEGYNNFMISGSAPCYIVPMSGHPPHIIPAHEVCPTITEGSLINFTNYNATNNKYELYAEHNFWRPLTSPTDFIEDKQNKIRKIDLSDPNFPILDSASIITGNILTDNTQVVCPSSNPNPGTDVPSNPHMRVHPLDDNSNSSSIVTASFYNKKLQKAIKFSLNKMDKMQNSAKVNQAADLFTEVLKYNYSTPVTNPVDKYLLEIAYQKLFTCVAQLVEWHNDTATSFFTLPASLQTRKNDLQLICNLRTGRKSISDIDYKEISDLILLDKAMIHRLFDDRTSALSIVNVILGSNPKSEHISMYQHLQCIWSSEQDAINNVINLDEFLARAENCRTNHFLPPTNNHALRMVSDNPNSSVTYSYDYPIMVFPNPTSGSLTVAYSLSEYSAITMEITDIQGKILAQYNLSKDENKITIDDLNLQNGIYFYTIKGDKQSLMTKKIVIVK